MSRSQSTGPGFSAPALHHYLCTWVCQAMRKMCQIFQYHCVVVVDFSLFVFCPSLYIVLCSDIWHKKVPVDFSPYHCRIFLFCSIKDCVCVYVHAHTHALNPTLNIGRHLEWKYKIIKLRPTISLTINPVGMNSSIKRKQTTECGKRQNLV